MHTRFDPRLESLRGLAALGVAWTHGQMVLTSSVSMPTVATMNGVLTMLLPAGGAVILFFVLSGYVLGASLLNDTSYWRYALRRLARILPALWVSVVVMAILLSVIGEPADKSAFQEWFRNCFWQQQTLADIGRNLILAKTSLNPVSWTLVPEVVCSLILPALVYVHLRVGLFARFAMLAALAALGLSVGDASAQYLFCFYAGMFLPREVLGPMLRHRAVAIAAALVGWFLIIWGNPTAYEADMRLTCAVGAIILLSALCSPTQPAQWLSWAPLRFLGRVSYSFYLLSLPAIFLVGTIAARWPDLFLRSNLLIDVVALGVALAAAAVSYRYVELPAVRWAKSFTTRSSAVQGPVPTIAGTVAP